MINTSRPVDILLFNLQSNIIIDDISLSKGWNQLRKEKNVYAIYHLKDLHNPYAFLSYPQLPKLFHVVFANLINSFYLEENENLMNENLMKKDNNVINFPMKMKA